MKSHKQLEKIISFWIPWILLFCLYLLVIYSNYKMDREHLFDDSGRCPEGYTCEKIEEKDDICWQEYISYNYTTQTIRSRFIIETLEYDSKISRVFIDRKNGSIELVYWNNGTEIPRCSNG